MPAYGYSQEDLRRWDETGIDPHDVFTPREAPLELDEVLDILPEPEGTNNV